MPQRNDFQLSAMASIPFRSSNCQGEMPLFQVTYMLSLSTHNCLLAGPSSLGTDAEGGPALLMGPRK